MEGHNMFIVEERGDYFRRNSRSVRYELPAFIRQERTWAICFITNLIIWVGHLAGTIHNGTLTIIKTLKFRFYFVGFLADKLKFPPFIE